MTATRTHTLLDDKDKAARALLSMGLGGNAVPDADTTDAAASAAVVA